MKSSRFLFLLVALFFSKARAQDGKNCALWVATIYDNYVGPGGLTIKSPQVARLLGVAKQIDTLLKKNASFNSIPESRLRTYISLNKSVGVLGARINVIAYSKKGWDENCGIIPQADRIAANDGGLYFLVNAPWHLYVSSKQTDHIFGYLADVGAFVEPVLVEQRPNDIKIFMTGVTRQRFAMLTYDRQIPWMPFFIGEYLDAYATTFRKKEKELEAERKRASYYPADREREQKKIQQKYESIKKTDAGKAAEWLAMKKNNLVVADENYKRKLRWHEGTLRYKKKFLHSSNLKQRSMGNCKTRPSSEKATMACGNPARRAKSGHW